MLAQLRHEMQTDKPIRLLRDADVDVAAWNAALSPAVGFGWYATPWLLAECYMYRRIHEALLHGGPLMRALDPFAPQKREAFAASAPAVAAMAHFVLAHEAEDIFDSLLLVRTGVARLIAVFAVGQPRRSVAVYQRGCRHCQPGVACVAARACCLLPTC